MVQGRSFWRTVTNARSHGQTLMSINITVQKPRTMQDTGMGDPGSKLSVKAEPRMGSVQE